MIKELKDFEKLLKLCRKHGVMEAEVGDIKLKLREDPMTATLADEPDPNELTEEQLMFYSAGVPEQAN